MKKTRRVAGSMGVSLLMFGLAGTSDAAPTGTAARPIVRTDV